LLLRTTLIFAPALLLTRVSALLLLVIATRLISQTEYGLLTLVVTIGEMTDIAVSNWLRVGFLRLGGKNEVSRGSFMLAAKVVIGTMPLALLISAAAAAIVVPERWGAFALAVGAYLLVGMIGRFGLTVLQMQQRNVAYSMLEALRAALQFVLPVVTMVLFHGSSFLVVSLSSSLGALIAALAACAIAIRGIVAGPARFSYRELFAIGVPMIVLAVFGFGLNSAERILLKLDYDAAAVAVFAAAYALARQPIDLVANAVNTGGFPELVSRFDRDGPRAAGAFLGQQMALMLRLSLPVVALLVALSGEITQIVLPPSYQGHLTLLFPIVGCGVVAANLMSFVFVNIIHAHKRPWLLIFSSLPGSVATIALSLLLIPPLAEIGAALALLGGAVVGLGATVAVTQRLTPVPVPWRDIGLSVAIAAAAGVAAALGAAAMGESWAIVRLVAGGLAGGAIFLGGNSLVHPEATRQLARKLRGRLGMA
jgi:O-antigen/teichoic acid export membrane protein